MKKFQIFRLHFI